MQTLVNSTRVITFTLIALFFTSIISITKGQEKSKMMKKENTHTFLIKLPHTPEKCLQTLDNVIKENPGLLTKIDWGCKSGDHTGYMIMKSASEKEALAMLTTELQKIAKIEKVGKFTPEQIKAYHE